MRLGVNDNYPTIPALNPHNFGPFPAQPGPK
jgi:hypothetical protein